MASEVEICNRALSRIGVSELIEDLLDPTVAANACNQHYASCRDEALEDFAWNFAQEVVPLALVSGVTVPGYAYVYRYPTNCLKARVVTDESGQRLPAQVCRSDIWEFDYLTHRAAFRVMSDPVTDGARIIVTDMADAYLWFTKRVTDPNQFTALFRSALAWKIAPEIALLMRADARLSQNAAQQYRIEVSLAQASSLNEEVHDPQPESPSIQARN
jgi:hypothetical protein